MTNSNLTRTSTLNGEEVKNSSGDSLGHVKDIMLDTVNNRIAYFVLSFGGILGMGDKFFAIPPEALKRNMDDKGFTLNIDKARLEKAQGFDKDHWPNMADTTFRTNLYNHYGMTDRFAA